MKTFKNYLNEAKMDNFQLVDMDPDTARIAVQLAKKAGLTPKSKKSRSGGLDISVEGPKKKVAKFIMSLPESNANWAKSLEKIQKQRQLDKISDKDKETLMKIAALLGKEKR